MYRFCSPLLVFLVVVCLPAYSASPELERHLKDQYQGKVFLLRGFPSGEKLRYDASGSPTGNVVPGTWTIDGFVLIDEARVDGPNLAINGRRMPVVSLAGFQFAADSPKKRKKAPKIHIDAEIGPGADPPEVDVLLAKIFLMDSESLLAFVPSYWRTCVAAGLNNVNDPKYAGCRLSPDMLAVRGANAHANLHAIAQRNESEQPQSGTMHVLERGKGVSPPEGIFVPEPQYPNAAREIGLALDSVITLELIVNEQGLPRNIEIVRPIGAGLDEEAVRTVSTWRFKPAEKAGQPVAVKIAVQVRF